MASAEMTLLLPSGGSSGEAAPSAGSVASSGTQVHKEAVQAKKLWGPQSLLEQKSNFALFI